MALCSFSRLAVKSDSAIPLVVKIAARLVGSMDSSRCRCMAWRVCNRSPRFQVNVIDQISDVALRQDGLRGSRSLRSLAWGLAPGAATGDPSVFSMENLVMTEACLCRRAGSLPSKVSDWLPVTIANNYWHRDQIHPAAEGDRRLLGRDLRLALRES